MLERRREGPKALVLVAGRGGGAAAQRAALLAEAAARGAAIIEMSEVGRTRSGVDRARDLGRRRAIDVLLVSSIGVLARGEAHQLLVATELIALGLRIYSLSEPWLAECGDTIKHVALWLVSRERTRRSLQMELALSRARASGVRLGRPRKNIGVEALHLVTELGVARAARQLGVGASTLRRFVTDFRPGQRAVAAPSATFMSPTASRETGRTP